MAAVNDTTAGIMATSQDTALATEEREGHASHAPRGAFIVLEGLDRSGKTTQVKLLEKRIAETGRAVHLMRFPGMFPCDFLHEALADGVRVVADTSG